MNLVGNREALNEDLDRENTKEMYVFCLRITKIPLDYINIS